MQRTLSKTQKAAQLLGKLGGRTTLKRHGAKKLREWGKLGAEFGKLGGRPPKTERGKKR